MCTVYTILGRQKYTQSYKSPDVDQIPTEIIQAGGKILRSEIHELINSVWKKEELPQQ